MTTSLEALASEFGRDGSLWFAESPLGGTVAELAASGGARATVALKGAQVLSYIPAGGREVLWLSPLARLDGAKPARGGIPVCWPWFGAHPEGGDRPAHGFARTAHWMVVATSASADAVSIQLALGPDTPKHGLDGLECPLAASVEVRLGADLAVSLTTRNLGSQPARLTSALHTYFAVADIAEARVEGLGLTSYIDQLDAGRIKTCEGAIVFAGELDRIYQDATGEVMLVDKAGGRSIAVDKSGSRSTVVWNPGPAKAARLGDLGQEGYRQMVCIEPANAGADVVELSPGGMHTLATRISTLPR